MSEDPRPRPERKRRQTVEDPEERRRMKFRGAGNELDEMAKHDPRMKAMLAHWAGGPK